MLTVFGYGAPKSDKSAIELMKKAWGEIEKRSLEQIEIIDIKQKEELQDSWSQFIHTHHYDIHKDFFDSWIANHPRRTGEAYMNQYLTAEVIKNNPVPRLNNLLDLKNWYKDLINVEKSHL